MSSSNLLTPFLRWVGGKRWLLNCIQELMPQKYNNYHEPFLGGGSVYFSLKPPNTSYLSDLNRDLINSYIQVKNNAGAIKGNLKHYENNKAFYLKARNDNHKDNVKRATQFIYLNKTCFNGIYRVNLAGKFNVPYGDNTYKNFVDEDNLLLVSKLLKKAKIRSIDFAKTIDDIEKKDVIFLDPPYTVAHGNNGFIAYNQKLFTWDDQERLAEYINSLNIKKAYYILTNADNSSIEELYGNLGRKIVVRRASTVGGKHAKREKVNELLFTNIK